MYVRVFVCTISRTHDRDGMHRMDGRRLTDRKSGALMDDFGPNMRQYQQTQSGHPGKPKHTHTRLRGIIIIVIDDWEKYFSLSREIEKNYPKFFIIPPFHCLFSILFNYITVKRTTFLSFSFFGYFFTFECERKKDKRWTFEEEKITQ